MKVVNPHDIRRVIRVAKIVRFGSSSMLASRKIWGGGIAAASFSAVGPIWLGRQLEQKTAQKACAAMSF